jgi:4-amino-4-deoxy-L-arabinose transferase-like glycosyltransferase
MTQVRFDALRRHRRWLFAVVVLALLAQMATAMITTAVQQTPTIDEPVYVGTAEVYLKQHSLRYNPEHPPLGKLIIASGLVLAHPHFDSTFNGPQEAVGQHLLYASGNDAWRVMFFARLPMIILTLLFGLVVLAFAGDLVGPVGALVALAMYAFSPDVITNGSLATLDLPAAGFLLTSAWLLWRSRRRPLPYLVLAGLALGAAIASRMSALPAVPVLLLLVVLSVWQAGRSDQPCDDRLARAAGLGRHRSARLVGIGVLAAIGVAVIAVAVVWASYLVVDPRLRWTSPADLPAVHGLRGLLINLLPLPSSYRDGVRIQFGFENGTFGGFLFGRQYHGSLWYYLPAALLVKTPLGMLALWLAGAVRMLTLPRLRAAAAYVLVLPAVLLGSELNGSRDFGVRYAIFVPIFRAVAAAAVVSIQRRWVHLAAAALVLFVAVSSLRTYPYYLPYSNEAFGGPAKTYLRLHDSNSDWGQDLGRLADRLRQRYPGQPVWLIYKGSGVPSYYGIRSSDPLKVHSDQVSGLLVVSDDAIDKANARLKALIRTSQPIDQVGHSITIFRRTPA